jgi:hypothetical protein
MNQAVILGLARHVLTALGGYLVAKGLLDPAAVESIVGAVLTLGGVVWSAQSKKGE